MTNTQDLARRFERSWRALGASSDAGPVLARLFEAYRQPHRHYHTLEHIEHTLTWLDWAYSYAEEPHEIALALWFHDYAYDPRRLDNEAVSSQSARQELLGAGVAEARVARIVAMILATRGHEARRGDQALLIDIDLAILGASEERFARFEREVREEYRMFDELSYARGRAHALVKLALRDPVYATPLFAAELSAQAKLNLERALSHWQIRAAAH